MYHSAERNAQGVQPFFRAYSPPPAAPKGSAMNQDRRSGPNSELPTVAHAVDASGQTIAGYRVLQKVG